MSQFELDLRPYLDRAKTAVLYAAAFTYVAGKLAGEYYFENQEQVNSDLLAFWEAVKSGTTTAVRAVYNYGREARADWDDARPSIDALLTRIEVVHNRAAAWTRERLGK